MRSDSIRVGNRALSVLYSFLKDIEESTEKKIILPINICSEVFDLLKILKYSILWADLSNLGKMDEEFLIREVSNMDTGIILYSHTYGEEFTPSEVFKKIKLQNNRIFIIDDRCLCKPSLHRKYFCSDLELYSTGAKKQCDLGKGGYSFSLHPFKIHNITVNEGKIQSDTLWNSQKINIGNYFNLIDESSKRFSPYKEVIKSIYLEKLNVDFLIPNSFNNWRFNVLLENKEEVLGELFQHGLFASNHYKPLGSMYSSNCYPYGEFLYNKVINLFIDQHYSEKMAKKTAQLINKHGRPIQQTIFNW